MRKICKKSEMEVIEFDTEYVITTSTGQGGGEDDGDGDNPLENNGM